MLVALVSAALAAKHLRAVYVWVRCCRKGTRSMDACCVLQRWELFETTQHQRELYTVKQLARSMRAVGRLDLSGMHCMPKMRVHFVLKIC